MSAQEIQNLRKGRITVLKIATKTIHTLSLQRAATSVILLFKMQTKTKKCVMERDKLGVCNQQIQKNIYIRPRCVTQGTILNML